MSVPFSIILRLTAVSAFLITTLASAASAQRLSFEPVATGLTAPVHAAFAPGDDATIYVAEEAGLVLEVVGGEKKEGPPFFDLRPYDEEEGETVKILSFAFHPEYETNTKIFISLVRKNESGWKYYLSEYILNPQTGRVNRETERVVLSLPQRGDHYGGGLAFAKDKTLYVGLGDGGGSHDPKNRAQNLHDLAGSILRINVDEGETYVPPLDNPFVMNDMGQREIYAFGFRDPWKLTLDRETGRVWVGDRGEDTYEEVNLVEPGRNYGWSVYEGKLCLRMRFECQNDTLVLPALMYTRQFGSAITGGYVYRGSASPALAGRYVYGDFSSGRVWAITLQNDKAVKNEELAATGYQISSFAEDSKGELYLTDYKGGGVYRISAAAPRKAVDAPPPAASLKDDAPRKAALKDVGAVKRPAKQAIRVAQ